MTFAPSQRPWRIAQPAPTAPALARELGLPLWMAQVLAGRGLDQADAARDFLSPQLATLPPFTGLRGLDKALDLLAPALMTGQTIGVAGDYDADGVTASALMTRALEDMGAKVICELPSRLEDGYGFTPSVVRRLADAGAQVVVTVDCGVSDVEGVAAAHELGLKVVVSDHHQVPQGPLVPAEAVINPQRADCGFCPHLSGVGVAFYLAAGLRARLDAEGWFGSRPKPNLRDSLDLVAVGTMADVVPLVDHNRVLVAEGLRVLSEGRRPGLAALARAARISPPYDARDVSFGLAPRINAAGRLGPPGPAFELLLTADASQATRLAGELERLNQKRKSLEQEITKRASRRVEEEPSLAEAACLVVAGEGWHQGVLGIVAARLAERFARPALVLSTQNGTSTGSGRSVEGFHLQRALAAHASLMDHFGGHAQAAGLTIPTANLPVLAEALSALAAEQLPPPGAPAPVDIEAQASLAELGPGAMAGLTAMGPFGQGNPEPMVAVQGAAVASAREVGTGHLKLEIIDPERGNNRLSCIGFNLAHLMPEQGQVIDLAGFPRISSFGGTHLELEIQDLKIPS